MVSSRSFVDEKTTSGEKEGTDPNITHWKEPVEEIPPKRNRTIKDWIVWVAGFILFLYVIGFVLLAVDNNGGMGLNFDSMGGKIAVIPIHGNIATQTTDNSVGYQDIADSLDEAENDSSVKAIFLDIESGGGSVVSTKQIVSKIRKLEKPVVSWIGEVGASGAYYIASAGDYIVADSDSITGSIGVISFQPNVADLLEKLGVEVNVVETGSFKSIGNFFEKLSEDEKRILQTIIDQAFENFKSDVILFRGDKLKLDSFSDVTDGRILSGKQALDIGLIDSIGTREEAISKAAELGGISGEPVLEDYFEKPLTLSDLFFSAGTQFGKGFVSSINNWQNNSLQKGI